MTPILYSALFLGALFGSAISQAKEAVPSYYAVIDSLTHRCFVMNKNRELTHGILPSSAMLFMSPGAQLRQQ